MRLAVLGVALVAFLATATLSAIWHHHSDNSEATCSICHVTHQPVDQSPASVRNTTLHTLGFQEETAPPTVVSAPRILRLPVRAPPTL